eukprot:CAMPEP_0204174448 /NCGR_PEP_ID=MMETSP0361-20130328/45888_1 /ASSEMBLY_ACC=CAM_ASM_000343 /TAXON_ID=268821 /ORGANISM="Scrippsiella Hangoei, Strain SHTV-5" /LENGTH=236 /DNA_ID=CAMNT_0051132923 /DNA_START=59 /DNA_END=767 /DNA_ORIENTATION=+
MDPQLVEYRRRQCERSVVAGAIATVQHSGRQARVFGIVAVAALGLLAVQWTRSGRKPEELHSSDGPLLAEGSQTSPTQPAPPQPSAPAPLAAAAAGAALAHQTAERRGGVCPEPVGLGICIEECLHHADCPESKLCCSNSCGHVCMTPVDPAALPVAKKCTLMVVRSTTSSASSIVGAVPTPQSHSELRAVGIVIIEYGPEQQADCCVAHQSLQAHQGVESAEFDGQPPQCAYLET